LNNSIILNTPKPIDNNTKVTIKSYPIGNQDQISISTSYYDSQPNSGGIQYNKGTFSGATPFTLYKNNKETILE
jgi:hypothetical protein